MELTCKQCGAKFRAAVQLPLREPVRVACPSCANQMVLKPRTGAFLGVAPPTTTVKTAAEVGGSTQKQRRTAAIADEPRPFRDFLGAQLRRVGFDVQFFDTGEPALDYVRRTHADLAIVNVYLKGKLGVEVSEEIKADAALAHTRVILIGALFRANRFRANPTNLYGADEYIEEQIPEKELTQIIQGLFPESNAQETPAEPREYDDARRLARLILSDIIIYHPDKVEKAIRDNTFFEVLHDQINEGREYYDSRVPLRVRRDTEIFTETMQQFVQMKREELTKVQAGR